MNCPTSCSRAVRRGGSIWPLSTIGESEETSCLASISEQAGSVAAQRDGGNSKKLQSGMGEVLGDQIR